MTRSLVAGDYSLLMAIESGSRPDSWYRVLTDRINGALSCDCPSWLFNHDQRTCTHTEVGQRLTATGQIADHVSSAESVTHPFITATQTQWPGLHGAWSIEERVASVKNLPFRFVLLRLDIGNGGTATGVVAFAEKHHHTQAEMEGRVAGWAGYAIAAEVARLGGYPMAGQPPEHFKVDVRPSRRRVVPQHVEVPAFSLRDMLRVGDRVDLGDSMTPKQRAEMTLSMFLGSQVYQQLEIQGFLDVSSVRHEGRVYRLRRDPYMERERRIRVFENGSYRNDFCVVSAMPGVPIADIFLTNFLGLLSDETQALAVVQRHNVFQPFSDGDERETIPAVWRPRSAPAMA